MRFELEANTKVRFERDGIYQIYCKAMQGAALPQASLIKGGFGGIVYMSRSPPPATKKGETISFEPIY